MYVGINVNPTTMKITKIISIINDPLNATFEAFLLSFSPNDFDKLALIPTPIPVDIAIIKFCIGNASPTAVKASFENLPTYILSTMLYND